MPSYVVPYAPQQTYAPNGRIVDLIRAQGQDAARAAELRGQQQAQLWGNVSNTIAAVPQAIAQAKEQQQEQEFRKAQLGNVKALGEERAATVKRQLGVDQQNKAIDDIMQKSMTTDPTTGVKSFDRQSFEGNLVSGGMGHLYPSLAETLDKLDASASKRNAEGRTMLAHSLVGIGQAGYTPESVLSAAAYLKANNVISADHLQPALEALADDPSPENVKKIVTGLGQQIPEYQALQTAEEKRAAELAKTKAETLKLEAEAKKATEPPKETRSLDVQAAAALAAGDMDTYNRLLKVKKEMGQADDRPRVNVSVAGPNANIPGDWNKTGEDFLQTIPAQWRKTVEKIAKYDEDPTKVASMRGGMREVLTQWVNQVNPSYDASQFSNRAPTRKAFTTGTQGKQINNINTALGHIDQLTTVANDLQNGGFVPSNKAYNAVRTMFGSDKVTNFDTLKDALAGEVAGVLSQSGATVSGIEEAKKKIGAANSPTQLAGYVKTLIPIMGSKLASLDYQFHQAMGEQDSFSALSPESKRILTKHGFDPAHPEIGKKPETTVKILSITPVK